MNIQKGDVVQLKSGGEIMTVRWVEHNEAYCEWFNNQKVEGHKFDVN